MTVRTRFAPSPTGYLHIGGVRTALFNWLFARQHGGQFILRIDDTDQQRNVEQALQPILRGFRWLGLDWDEGPEVGGPHAPYYQSQRLARYQQAVEQLLAAGAAYRDYARTEEIQAQRAAAEQAGEPFVYDRRYRADTAADQARLEAQGRTGVVRLLMPRSGECVFHDHVRGRVAVPWASEQDHVVQRADGTCLYHLASVVDDFDFGITHVIRAEEHLSNTPRQIFIAQALGYPLPEYAHVPFVAEPGSKNKLSKRKLDKYLKHPDFAELYRHGEAIARALGLSVSAETFNPVIVDFYEQVGYLPDAIVNYLLLLGWSLDDRTEWFTRAAMIEHFSLQRVQKSPASFDCKKLWAFQDHYMRQLPTARKVELMRPYLVRAGLVSEPLPAGFDVRLARIIEAAGDRLKTAGDILQFPEFFVSDEQLAYDPADFEKRIVRPPEAAALLEKFRCRLAEVPAFDAPALERLLHDFAAAEGIKIGQIIHALRVAVTGRSVGLGMFDTLEILGRDACLARIDRALALRSA